MRIIQTPKASSWPAATHSMVIRILQINVLLLLLMSVTACQTDNEEIAQSAPSSKNLSSPSESQTSCREFNDRLVYNSAFAEVFSLDPEKAVDMDPSLMAARCSVTSTSYAWLELRMAAAVHPPVISTGAFKTG